MLEEIKSTPNISFITFTEKNIEKESNLVDYIQKLEHQLFPTLEI